MAYSVGGGIAGALSARDRLPFGRRGVLGVGLAGAGLAALCVGHGDVAPVTIAGALLMGLFGTFALIRVWAELEIRRRRPQAFLGAYEPIDAGAGVCAFMRGEEVLSIVAVRARGDERLPTPPQGEWRDAIAGAFTFPPPWRASPS